MKINDEVLLHRCFSNCVTLKRQLLDPYVIGELFDGLFRNPYTSPAIRVIKSRWMRRPGHVAHMRDARNAYKIHTL
jgi:hypothetical protein